MPLSEAFNSFIRSVFDEVISLCSSKFPVDMCANYHAKIPSMLQVVCSVVYGSPPLYGFFLRVIQTGSAALHELFCFTPFHNFEKPL